MRIVCAMSGGVDSSVAAALLAEEGHEVVGVHMKLHDAPDGAGHCCGLDDALDARRVADRLGIPFYVMDLREAFRRAVMQDFADAYARGLTPNPCVQCNGVLKFDVLLTRARTIGAEALATGHYARTTEGRLYAATDASKDQSYFLWPVRSEALRMVRFPLGGMSKPQVRAHAMRLGLATAQKPESMEVCFVPDDDHTRFVREMRPDLEGAGEVVDEAGAVLGGHDAWWRFTVGQRRGIGLAGGPWYVLRVEPESRRVVVGPEERLHSFDFAVDIRWIRAPAGEELAVRVRHRGGRIACEVDGGRVRLRAPARAIARGQSAVVYAGEEVLGGGIIA